MFDTRKKATMPQVLAEIKPYLTKRFLSEPVIDDRCLPVIGQMLLRRYSNVKLVQGVTDNKPNLRIRVEGALSTKERSFEVVHTGGRKSVVPDRCTGGGTERRPVRPAHPAQAGESPVSGRTLCGYVSGEPDFVR